MCWASPPLPPLPQKNSVPPVRTVACTMASPRARSASSSVATRSAVAASSRSAALKDDGMKSKGEWKGEAMDDACSAAHEQLAQPGEDAAARSDRRNGDDALAVE